MSIKWFVVRDGKEVGPVTAQRLKEMVVTEELAPSDLVRRDDMKTATKAGSIKGLFPKDVEQDDPASPQTRSRLPLIVGMAVGAVLLLSCCGGLGFMAFLGNKLEKTTRAELAEGDSLWEKGDKEPAAAKYRAIIDARRVGFVKEDDRPRLFGRVIDFEYDRGDAAAGKAVLDKADKDGVVPAVTHADAKVAVASVQAEKARAEAEKAEWQRAAQAKKTQEERHPKLSPQEKLKQAKSDEFVSAVSLFEEFRGNEVAASEKYRGKTIRVVGEVESVEKGGVLSSDRILLRGGVFGVAVSCSVSRGSANELKQLRPGNLVRVEGRCDGRPPLGGVDLSGCVFVQVDG